MPLNLSNKKGTDTVSRAIFGGIIFILFVALSPVLFGDIVFNNPDFLAGVPVYVPIVILVAFVMVVWRLIVV